MYSAIDAGELIASILAYVPLVILPGFAIASLTGALGWKAAPGAHRWLLALVVGLATLPVLESMAVRLLGLTAAVVLNLSLGAIGLALLVRSGDWPRPRWSWSAALAAWLAIVIFEFIDFDVGGQLHQSLLVFDMVKHAATIRAIASSGAPPIDPFFFRPGRSGYYYFFYTLPALLVRTSGNLLDARAAFAGLTFWTGPGLFGLASSLLAGTGLANGERTVRVQWIVLALLACTGLAIVGVTLPGIFAGQWYQQIDWWNEEVTTWANSLLWVPHHVTALIASWVALAEIAGGANQAKGTPRRWVAITALATLCFATSFGASVWVTLVTFVTVACWSIFLLISRRWAALTALAIAGALALVIDAPAIFDLIRNRHDAGLPIALTIRSFAPWDFVSPAEPARTIGRLVLLPINYAMEFGIFALGAWVFWRHRRAADVHSVELSRLLTIGAIIGLLVGTFLRSTVLSNDLGWRAMMFPQIACLIWTAVALDDVTRRAVAAPDHRASWMRRLPFGAWLMLLLGYCGVAYTLVCARLPSAYFETAGRFINASPPVDRDLRAAYEWANGHLSSQVVLQHNPAPDRVFDFGLYGRNRVAVSDQKAILFGAPEKEARERLSVFTRLFQITLPVAEVRIAALKAGVGALVATSTDPVWADRASWVWTTPAIFHNAHVRIIAVKNLGERLPSPIR